MCCRPRTELTERKTMTNEHAVPDSDDKPPQFPHLRLSRHRCLLGQVRALPPGTTNCVGASAGVREQWSPSTVEASRAISGTTRGQDQLSTLSGTGGNQPGITGKGPTAGNRTARHDRGPSISTLRVSPLRSARATEIGVHGPFQDPRQRHDLRLLAHVKPGDSPADDHALDLRRTLEDREARGGPGSFRR
jgi:hypothetical protein